MQKLELDGTTLRGYGFVPKKAVHVVMKGVVVASDYVWPDADGNFEIGLVKATVEGEYFLEVQEVGSSTAMPLTTGFKIGSQKAFE